MNLDLRPKQPPQHVVDVRDDAVEIDAVRHRCLPPAEREQLLRQRPRALDSTAHRHGRMPRFRCVGNLFEQLVAVAEQHGNQVVEIVRDTRGQAAHRLHLLRLPQLVLEAIALAQVFRDRHHADDLAVSDQHSRVHLDRHAIAAPPRQLRSKRLRLAGSAVGDHLIDGVKVVVAENPVRVEHPHFFARITQRLLAGAIDRRQAAAAIVHHHDVARALEHIVEARLQRRFPCQLPANGLLAPGQRPHGVHGHANGGQDDGKNRPDPEGRGHDVQGLKVTKGRLYHETGMGSTSPRIARMTMPARAYTQGAWFADEMERVFARMWLAAGRTAELDRPGAFIRREVAGASVLIVRANDGSIRAFHNVCRHRGTRLCIETHGTFQGSIQCPYHAWTYSLDGRLIAAPQMDDVGGFDRSAYPLHAVACDTWDGHIFINLSTAPSPLGVQLTDLPARFAPWRMQELRLAHRIEYDVATNWKLVVQNYNECLHCPIIHPLLNRMHHYLAADNVPTTGTYCGEIGRAHV